MTVFSWDHDTGQGEEAPPVGSWSATLRALLGTWHSALPLSPPELSRLVLALVLAGGLWVYVTAQTNPVITMRIPGVTIVPRNLPRNYVISPSLGTVTVVLQALEHDLQNITASSIVATVDSHFLIPNTSARLLPVIITLPAGLNITLLKVTPDHVPISVDNIATRSFPVVVLPIGQTPAGYSTSSPPSVDPQSVTITGLSSILDRIRSATVGVNLDNAVDTIQEEIAPSLVDPNGRLIRAPSLNVTPPVVQVTVPVQRQFAVKSVPVTPFVPGVPRPGWRLVALRVVPQAVSVFGSPVNVANLTMLPTDPVNVDGMAGTVSVSITVRPPVNVGVSSGQLVRVTLTFDPILETVDLPLPVVVQGVPAKWQATDNLITTTVRLQGPAPSMGSLPPLVAVASISSRPPGTYRIPLTVSVPAGLHLISATPPTVMVRLTAPDIRRKLTKLYWADACCTTARPSAC